MARDAKRTWTERDVQDLLRAWQPATLLLAAADLGLFEAIGEERPTAEEVAGRIGGDLRGTRILLDALAALDLLEKDGETYAVPPTLRPWLSPGQPGSVLAMARHQANCQRRWTHLARTIRDGRPTPRTPSVRGEEGDRASFIEAMDEVNRTAAPDVVRSLLPLDFRHLLDVGGASGTWTIAFLSTQLSARATLFDLPPVIPLARERLAWAGLLGRVRLVGGDFHQDPLPAGADLAWLSAIAHQHSREQNRALFASVHAALVPGGRILVRDVVMEEDRIRPVTGALFAANMLAGTAGGGTYTLRETREDLESAGFATVRHVRRDEGMHAVVSATKAS